MFKNSLQLLLVCLAVALSLAPTVAISGAQTNKKSLEYQLVVHPDIKLSKVQKRELRNIFTLRRSVWPNGIPIQIVVMNRHSTSHGKFVEKHLALLTYQVERVWERQIFSGASLKPIEVSSPSEVLSVVAKTPGAIGYIIKSEQQEYVDETVKVINLDY
jgi:ABC-type phosphate transport system substrate-binding protein